MVLFWGSLLDKSGEMVDVPHTFWGPKYDVLQVYVQPSKGRYVRTLW